jgi:hypothetical protein
METRAANSLWYSDISIEGWQQLQNLRMDLLDGISNLPSLLRLSVPNEPILRGHVCCDKTRPEQSLLVDIRPRALVTWHVRDRLKG